MIDVVYPLGGGSPWDNNELRYSLRSVQKHLKHFRHIYIVGEKPTWLKWSANLIHLPFVDELMWKEINIFRKLVHVSRQPEVTEDFLMFNDDHFLLQDYDAPMFPYYYKNKLEDAIARKLGMGRYKRALMNTQDVLIKRLHSTTNFDGHCPIRYNKGQMLDLATEYNWAIDVGYVLKSLYCNTYNIKGEYDVDCKLTTQLFPDQIREGLKGKRVFSIGNGVLQPTPDDLLTVLNELYPEPSQWEAN